MAEAKGPGGDVLERLTGTGRVLDVEARPRRHGEAYAATEERRAITSLLRVGEA